MDHHPAKFLGHEQQYSLMAFDDKNSLPKMGK
jgi:hypothetical protein